MSKYEMTGFRGNKFYYNCTLIPGFFIEMYNLYELFHMTVSEMLLHFYLYQFLFLWLLIFLLILICIKDLVKILKKEFILMKDKKVLI